MWQRTAQSVYVRTIPTKSCGGKANAYDTQYFVVFVGGRDDSAHSSVFVTSIVTIIAAIAFSRCGSSSSCSSCSGGGGIVCL